MTANDQDKPVKKLETDEPLSEKDEVKRAEHKVAQAQQDVKESVKADLKSREK